MIRIRLPYPACAPLFQAWPEPGPLARPAREPEATPVPAESGLASKPPSRG